MRNAQSAGSGAMPGRTWIIAPDKATLERRWNLLIAEKDAVKRAVLFHPHEGGDRTIDKPEKKGLPGHHGELSSIEFGLMHKSSTEPEFASKAGEAIKNRTGTPYGFRSFDRQYIIPDKRLINRPNPALWAGLGKRQVFLTALSRSSSKSGPAVTMTAAIPDLDHYKGSFGGRVFPLWKDAAATQPNIAPSVLKALATAYGAPVDPVDVFAYVAGVLAHPAFTSTHRDDLVRPGLRVPINGLIKLGMSALRLSHKKAQFCEDFSVARQPLRFPASAPFMSGFSMNRRRHGGARQW